MAGALNVRHGAKMRIAFDVPVGQDPQFNMICTFNKALDESAFLVSIPMVNGKALTPDETQKMLKISGNRELYARDKRDALILFALQHKKTIWYTNELLFSHNLTVLGLS